MISRRLLLKLMASGIFTAAFTSIPAVASFFFAPKRKVKPGIRPNLFTRDGFGLVGISGGDKTVKEKISEAVELIGGFDKLVLKGKTVLVKPNVVSGAPHPTTTNPDVVGAVVSLLLEHGAAKVYVGDMSAMATLSTMRNMRRCGIKKAAEEAGAQVLAFEDHDWVEVALPGNRFVKKAYVTRWIFDADIVVNLPVIKTHRSATYTITLKNFIGCTHLMQRPYIVDSSHWEEVVAEFNAAWAPDLNIVDGTVSMIEGGPWEGTGADTGIILASADRVAADIVGLGVIKTYDKWPRVSSIDVWEQKQIKTALSLGIGMKRENLKLAVGRINPEDRQFAELVENIRKHTRLAT